jgi:hypothetical protein
MVDTGKRTKGLPDLPAKWVSRYQEFMLRNA